MHNQNFKDNEMRKNNDQNQGMSQGESPALASDTIMDSHDVDPAKIREVKEKTLCDLLRERCLVSFKSIH